MMRLPNPRRPWYVLAGFGLLLVSIGVLLLYLRPTRPLDQSYGLYATEGGIDAYRWSSNRARFTLPRGTGPTLVALVLGDSNWPGRSAPPVSFALANSPITGVLPTDRPRHYTLLLPPGTPDLYLNTAVSRAPGHDARWLGVKLLDIHAAAMGWLVLPPIYALLWTSVVALAMLLVVWSHHHGSTAIMSVLLLAFVLRTIWLSRTPPGFNQDEAVSLIDALHYLRTGHDHLGNRFVPGVEEALGDWISPLLTYLELPLVAFLGPVPLAGRLVTALVGTIGVLWSYKVARLLHFSTAAATLVALVAGISPWQVFLQRFALPPALVPTSWILCIWAALLFVRSGTPAAALRLALVAGVALYAYPTLKLAIPLLVAWATLLALLKHGGRSARRWLLPALLLAVIWFPFLDTTFSPAANTRLGQVTIRAHTAGEWLSAWWAGYRVYGEPAFYYTVGDEDPIHGVPGHGQQLTAEAPLLLLGLGLLVWKCVAPLLHRRPVEPGAGGTDWWCLAGALLISPLPASLTLPAPHAWRAGTLAPLYALLVGLGLQLAAASWQRLSVVSRHRALGPLAMVTIVSVLLWQAAMWFQSYATTYPPSVAWTNQDGLAEAMQYVLRYAPQFESVWVSTDQIVEPYVYVVAAQPLPPATVQANLVVERRPSDFNDVLQIGPYHFRSLQDIPLAAPILEAIPDHFGGPGFVLQEAVIAGHKILVLRRME